MAQLSAGTLCFLFADRVVPAAGALGGTETPYSGQKVSTRQLAPLLFALSFWGLRQQGHVTLEKVQRKSMGMFRQDHALVRPGAVPPAEQRTGYDDVILRAAYAAPHQPPTARDVVWRWFARDTSHPFDHVVGLARQEMVQHGLASVVDAQRGAVAGLLMGRSRLEPHREQIGRHWSSFEQALAGWNHFSSTEPDLATTLVESCRKAISSRTESTD
jgi:hypothetical protein